jgi:hypothetical protein
MLSRSCLKCECIAAYSVCIVGLSDLGNLHHYSHSHSPVNLAAKFSDAGVVCRSEFLGGTEICPHAVLAPSRGGYQPIAPLKTHALPDGMSASIVWVN